MQEAARSCKNLSGNGFACANYATRSLVCKEFRCYRMLIFDKDGHECGRILGRNQFKTKEETLERIWDEEISTAALSRESPLGKTGERCTGGSRISRNTC